jgi:hypothetical protein
VRNNICFPSSHLPPPPPPPPPAHEWVIRPPSDRECYRTSTWLAHFAREGARVRAFVRASERAHAWKRQVHAASCANARQRNSDLRSAAATRSARRIRQQDLKKEYKEREREREKEAKQFPIAEIAAMTLNYSHTWRANEYFYAFPAEIPQEFRIEIFNSSIII